MIDIKCSFEKQISLTYFDAFPDWVIQSCNVVLLSSDNIDIRIHLRLEFYNLNKKEAII